VKRNTGPRRPNLILKPPSRPFFFAADRFATLQDRPEAPVRKAIHIRDPRKPQSALTARTGHQPSEGARLQSCQKSRAEGASLLPQAVVGASHRASYSANGAETRRVRKNASIAPPIPYSLFPIPCP
jgi:hypothetical protein